MFTGGTLPTGWQISSRLLASCTFQDGSTIEVGLAEYYVTEADGEIVAQGTDFHPSVLTECWEDVLCSFISFLEHDAEVYGHYMGQVPKGHDPYLFGLFGAEWAYSHSNELSEIRYDMDPEGVR